MGRRIEIGTLFLLFGLALLSTESGQAQIGAISYTVNLSILKGFAVVAFGVSFLYFLSLLLWITNKSWLMQCESFIISHFPEFLIYPSLTVYFSALFIVFTQGLILGVTKLPWENFRVPLLVFGLLWIVILGIDHIGKAYRLGKSARQNRMRTSGRNEWLGNIVENEMKLHNPSVSLFSRLGLKKPSWKTVILIVCVFGLSIIISWIISKYAPNSPMMDEDKLKDYYLAMWQVQGAIAAFALPLLIVAIEFSKDLRHVAGKRPEALVRESWIFPIIVFALLGTVRLGIDINWFLNKIVFVFDMVFLLVGRFLAGLLFTHVRGFLRADHLTHPSYPFSVQNINRK